MTAYRMFYCLKAPLFCCLFLLIVTNSFGQARRDYTFKNGNLVGVSESCLYILAPTSASLPMQGGTGTFLITCNASCAWTAVSSVPSWIHTTSAGNGNGTVSYVVDANPGSNRTGSITIGDQTFTIDQAMHCQVECPLQSEQCTSQVSSESCQGTCTQSVNQQYPACQDPAPPYQCGEAIGTCVTTCLGQGMSACVSQYNQCAASCYTTCNYTLSATSASQPATGSTGTVNVSSVACNWTATSNVSWLHTTSSGTGNGTVTYTTDANTGPARSATLTIAGQTFTVTQATMDAPIRCHPGV
jgi:hypothetical protein